MHRLRPKYTDEQLEALYASGYEHDSWQDHRLRINQTAELAKWLSERFYLMRVADLSAGDGAICAKAFGPEHSVVLGDLVKVNTDKYAAFETQFNSLDILTGRIEETVEQIEKQDLFICSETIEHIDDPVQLLQAIRAKTRYLILSTPEGETAAVNNLEHYWGWTISEMRAVMNQANFSAMHLQTMNFMELAMPYNFQLWIVE